jgi:hypothetical protein
MIAKVRRRATSAERGEAAAVPTLTGEFENWSIGPDVANRCREIKAGIGGARPGGIADCADNPSKVDRKRLQKRRQYRSVWEQSSRSAVFN